MSIININIILDIIITALSVWIAIVAVKGIGGLVGSAINTIAVAILILCIAFISKALLFRLTDLDSLNQELIHRLIVLVGFMFMGYGFQKIQNITKHMTGGNV